jgi:hypothetical protein
VNIITRHEQKTLISELLAIPTRINELQSALDMINATYESMLTTLTLLAYSEPLFPGKKEGDPLRIASNDDERKLAVQIMLQRDAEFKRVADVRDDAQRKLAYERNKLEAAKIIVKLIGEPQQ